MRDNILSMLKVDRIELALLNLIVDWHDPVGPTLPLTQLESTVSRTIGPVSDREVVDALLVLYDEAYIRIGRYIGTNFIQYDPEEGSGYFYGEAFRCTPRPKARRRQQELSSGDRRGVFISHISEEKPIALRIQKLLQDVLPSNVPVFVSSDYQSIQSGDQWYTAVLDGLKHSQVIIVLLSDQSVDRRWINFEAGFGLGQESRIIPTVCRAFIKDDIGLPLSQLHARDLHEEQELKALLNTIADILHVPFNDQPIARFLDDLLPLENQIPRTGLTVTPFMKDRTISLAIRNTGSRPLDLVDAELSIPQAISQNIAMHNHSPVREVIRFEDEKLQWVGFRLTTIPSPHPRLGIEPLRATLVTEAGEVLLKGLAVPLPQMLTSEQATFSIRYRVSARQMTIGPITISVSDIQKR
jgi:hypothetical protein